MLPRAAAALAFCLAVRASAAQSPAPPVFGAQADLVLVDVVVTDSKQRPVLDLVAADFRVYEDGLRRDVVSFAAFGAAATKALARAATAETRDAAAAQFVLASTVLLIDEGHISPKEAAQLGPVVAEVVRGLERRGGSLLVLAPHSNVAFAGRYPADSARLAEAAAHFTGQRAPQLGPYPMTDNEAIEIELGDTLTAKRVLARFAALNPILRDQLEPLMKMRAAEVVAAARARRATTLNALRLGLDWLARQPGRHGVLMLTSGFAHEPSDPSFQRIATQSLRVNAPIHFLDVAAVSAFRAFETIEYRQALPQDARASALEPTEAAAGADRVATDTGGLRVAASDPAGLERILETTRTYYVVGYEPPRRKKPGFRKIKVEVRGDGRRVLARRGYFDDDGSSAPRAR